MLEAEVHQQLRAFLRDQGKPYWSHHLTMARLVARALRVDRSALIQTDALARYQGRYRLSYLLPILMWDGPVVLVAPASLQQRLLAVEIPQLRDWIQTPKPIQRGEIAPQEPFPGLFLITPEAWLRDRISPHPSSLDGVPTVFDGIDDLEDWTRQQFTTSIAPQDWETLRLAYPSNTELIWDTQVQLTQSLYQRPVNPYDCCLIEEFEQRVLTHLLDALPQARHSLPSSWAPFSQVLIARHRLLWAELARSQGQFVIHGGPVEVASMLRSVWQRQPTVLIGGPVDIDAEAGVFRQRVGLGDLTCLKFAADRQDEVIHLYVPERLPLPNTPEFARAIVQEVHTLLRLSSGVPGLTVVLIGDVPLKAQVGSILASEFGSRVQVERTCLDDNGVLITGWEFWQTHQRVLPTPQLMVITTLPIPSLEHPVVAGRVAAYKQQHQDWFRLYLLPTALHELQRAIAPLRERPGIVALLDTRVIHRSYGQQVLTALHPFARVNYLEASLFGQPDYSLFD